MKSISELAAARVLRSRCSTSVLRKYLKDKDFSSEEIEPVIESFIEYGYLDDLQYCRTLSLMERERAGESLESRENSESESSALMIYRLLLMRRLRMLNLKTEMVRQIEHLL